MNNTFESPGTRRPSRGFSVAVASSHQFQRMSTGEGLVPAVSRLFYFIILATWPSKCLWHNTHPVYLTWDDMKN